MEEEVDTFLEILNRAESEGNHLIGMYDDRAKAAGAQVLATLAVAVAIDRLAETIRSTQ